MAEGEDNYGWDAKSWILNLQGFKKVFKLRDLMGLRCLRRSKKIYDHWLVGWSTRLFRSWLSSPVSTSIGIVALQYENITPNGLRRDTHIYTELYIYID